MVGLPEPIAPDPDIQLSEPRAATAGLAIAHRPDLDPQYAVQAIGEPSNDRRVFVAIDAWREIVAHAGSDTSVELGGLLLGYRCHDGGGHDSVVVTDALPARHYHATRGSFKFTHDTWSDLTQRRNAYPPSVVVLGWYHTHPGWGIFLSGMDRFICDHFFSDPAAVALVVDPLEQSAGWFHWSGPPPQARLERLPGFELFAHRGRVAELQTVAVQPVGELAMSPTPSTGPIILASKPSPSDRWLGLAVMISALSQLLLCVIVGVLGWQALRAVGTPADDSSASLNRARDELLVREQAVDQVLHQLAQGSDPALASFRATALENRQLVAANVAITTKLAAMDRALAAARAGGSAGGALSGDVGQADTGTLAGTALDQARRAAGAAAAIRWWPIEPVSFLYGGALVVFALILDRLRRHWVRQRGFGFDGLLAPDPTSSSVSPRIDP